MSLQLFKGDKATGIWVKADKAYKDLPCGCRTEASVQESEEGSLGVTKGEPGTGYELTSSVRLTRLSRRGKSGWCEEHERTGSVDLSSAWQ